MAMLGIASAALAPKVAFRSFAHSPHQQLLQLADVPRLFRGTAKAELSREAASRHLFQSMFVIVIDGEGIARLRWVFQNIELKMLKVNSVKADSLYASLHHIEFPVILQGSTCKSEKAWAKDIRGKIHPGNQKGTGLRCM